MRRVVGLVLAGLGTCLIVFAVLMPTYVSSRVLKFPLNEYETATLTGGNVSYFSPAKLTELTGVNMEATYTLKGNAAAGSSSTAVWNEFTYVYDETNKLPFQTLTRTFAFNRRNAQLIDCCGANVNGDSSIRQTGYVGYVLPIGTKKQAYDVFDANLNKPMPFAYEGTGTVNGIQTYKFVENVPATQNGTQTLPGSLVGQSQASVTLPQYYQNVVTYWIDPETGALLNVSEDEKLTLQNSAGAQALLLLDANLSATQPSINRVVAQDNSERSKVSLVSTILPLVTGILGVILLVVGIVLARRPREDVEAAPSATSPELAAARPESARAEEVRAEEARAEEAAPPAAQASLVPGLEDEPREALAQTPAVPAESPTAETEPEPEPAEAAPAEAEPPKADAPKAEAAAATAGVAVAGAAAVAATAKVKAKPRASRTKATRAAAPQAKAQTAQTDVAQTDATAAPAAEAPTEAKPETQAEQAPAATQETAAESPEPAAETPETAAAETASPQAATAATPAESPETAEIPVEATTAEMPATTAESPNGAETQETPAVTAPDAASADAPEDASATSHRRRRGARHRR
jgi:hypothetical protein